MVATTKGPAGAPGGKDVPPEQRATGSAQITNSVDLDEETYNRVLQLAANQQATPGEVIRRTIINAFGVGQPTGAWHSGQADDPALANREEGRPDTEDDTAADPDSTTMTGRRNTGDEKTTKVEPSNRTTPSERADAKVKANEKSAKK
jgi:hypothetical protein